MSLRLLLCTYVCIASTPWPHTHQSCCCFGVKLRWMKRTSVVVNERGGGGGGREKTGPKVLLLIHERVGTNNSSAFNILPAWIPLHMLKAHGCRYIYSSVVERCKILAAECVSFGDPYTIVYNNILRSTGIYFLCKQVCRHTTNK